MDFLQALYAEFMEWKLNLRDFQLQESRAWSLRGSWTTRKWSIHDGADEVKSSWASAKDL